MYPTSYRLQLRGIWEEVLVELSGRMRKQAGKEKEPTAAIIDPQSAKTVLKGATKPSTRSP